MTLRPIHDLRAATFTNEQRLRKASKDLETSFIAEMLKAAKTSDSSSSFMSGTGSGYFDGYMNEHYARALTRGNQIGLSEGIFLAMEKREKR